RKLERHAALFTKLKPVHMSSDEAAVEGANERQQHPRIFYIVEAAWQSMEFKTFVRTLDAMYIEDWKSPTADRLPGGNTPRVRVARQNARIEETVAPKGLWRNCYDATWLEKLKPHQRKRLNVIDKDYVFSLTPEE
ncbi:hypothetical protein BV20DRAFT_936833, partial [Pilatotrama ljubarskyi]